MEADVVGVPVVEQRELQRERILLVWYSELIRQAVDWLAVDDKVGEVYISQFHLLGSHSFRVEGGDAVTCSEGDEVAGGMHGGTQYVFTGGESVAIDVPDKLSVLLVILPDAHGGAYPQVALMVFDDAAHLLSLQNFGVRESKGLVVLSVEKIESFFRSDNHIAVLSFADAIRLSVFQNDIPSEVLEAECLRVEAGNAI